MENSGNQSNPTSGTDPKTVGIVAYLTLIGWIVALILNNPKSEHGSFHIRQMLGIILLGFLLGIIPFINLIGWIIPLVLWIMGFIGAVQGQQKLVPVVGQYFQDWFKGL